jgi:Ankyrin repeats (many copies)
MSAAAVSAVSAAASVAPSASASSTSTSSSAAAASSSLDAQLIAATRDGKGLEECKSLIEKGAGVNAKNSSRNTALHYAARYGQDAIAKLLLEHGAVPNVKNTNGWTPLVRDTTGGPLCGFFSFYLKQRKAHLAHIIVIFRHHHSFFSIIYIARGGQQWSCQGRQTAAATQGRLQFQGHAWIYTTARVSVVLSCDSYKVLLLFLKSTLAKIRSTNVTHTHVSPHTPCVFFLFLLYILVLSLFQCRH